jgi:1-phosphofructokinase
MGNEVMVFVPAPQLTVTIEQPTDQVEIHLHAGGQGIWQARMLRGLGASVTLCAAVGGEIGAVLTTLMAQGGVDLHTVERADSSGAYIHDRRGGSREVVADVAGEPLSRHDLDELYNLALAKGLAADVAILSAPTEPDILPPDVYRRLASDLANGETRVVADLSGENLDAVIAGNPYFVKVSHEELIKDGRADGDTEDALIAAMHRVRDEGARSVLVSRADQPALALIDDEVVEVRMPKLEATDPRGAGDSMTAGVAAVLARGGDLREALRTGAAAGAVNVTRHGLGSGRADVIEQLVDRVELISR